MFGNDIISEIDRTYIEGLVKQGERIDGRKVDEYRPISIKVNLYEKAEGSAEVRIGNTRVVAGVKVSVGEPFPDTPNMGVVTITAELAPIASPSFESGPPGDDAIELARIVDRGIRESEAVDVEKLCIKEGKLVYIIFVDIYTIEYDGNLYDASSLAAIAALMTTKLPEVVLDENDNPQLTGNMIPMPIQSIPIEVTTALIGNNLVVDPSLKEEQVMNARLTIAVDEQERLTTMQKGGVYPISESKVYESIDLAVRKSKEIRKILLEVINSDKN